MCSEDIRLGMVGNYGQPRRQGTGMDSEIFGIIMYLGNTGKNVCKILIFEAIMICSNILDRNSCPCCVHVGCGDEAVDMRLHLLVLRPKSIVSLEFESRGS